MGHLTAGSGSLLPAAAAPVTGERFEAVLDHRNLAIRQILSGHIESPQEYLQDDDEWVLLLAGAAQIEVAGERLALGPGDWAFLPADVPHTVLETAAGTSWLAVHLRPA
jgi:cupin 2 domain-containing protein